jgi:PAS domain S-box-containing protein
VTARQYGAIFDQDPDALVVTDTEGRIHLINAQAEVLFGYARAELLGQPVELLLPERLHAAHRHHRNAYAAAPRSRPMGADLLLLGRRQDGSEFPVEIALRPFSGDEKEHGEPLVIAHIRDMSEWQRAQVVRDAAEAARTEAARTEAEAARTEAEAARAEAEAARAEAERQANQLNLLFEAMTDGVLVYDTAGTLVRTNAVARALLSLDAAPPGYSELPVRERLAYFHLRDAQGRPLAPRDLPQARVLRGEDLTGTHAMEIRVRTLDGRELDLIVSGGGLRDPAGRLVGVVGILHDQTEHNALQSEREHADRLLRAHAARTSHELRQRLERERAAMVDMMRARDQLGALQALTDTALYHFNLKDLLPEMLERLQDIMAVDNIAILLLAANGQMLEGLTALGPERRFIHQVRVPVGEGFAGRIASTRQPLIVADLAHFPVVNPMLQERLRSALGVPLVVEQKLVGVMHVGTAEPHVFTEADVQLLEQAAGRVAVAIDRANAYDAGGRVVRTNPAARRILGLDVTQSAYGELPALERAVLYEARDEQGNRLAPEDWPLVRVLSGKVHTGADGRDIWLRTLDGRDLFLHTSAAPLRDQEGRLVGAVTILHNQTERNRLEREREEAQARELAAQEVAQQLDQFFKMAAHDIQTPITALSGNVQLARTRLQHLEDALQTRGGQELDLARAAAANIARLEANTTRLIRLVDLLFDVARARSGTLTLALVPCDVAVLVQEQVATQQAAAPGRSIDVDVPGRPVVVLADADRLGQVLSNYLTNATKYSPDDQPVVVRLEVTEQGALVSVRDHGPGLPEEEQRRVWELYHRAPGVEVQSGTSATRGSLGLGLYICKQLMELHLGGEVGVESAVGEGSTFWFRLPLAAEASTAPHAEA